MQNQPSSQTVEPNSPFIGGKQIIHMHEWESQEKLLSNLEQQDVLNFLEYKDFQYQKHEWDNIPPIVPKYLIYLGKYMKGISSFCNLINTSESTFSLRQDLDNKYKELLENIRQKRKVDVEEKTVMNGELDKINSNVKKIQTDMKNHQTEVEENLQQDLFKIYDQPEFQLLEHLSFFETPMKNPKFDNDYYKQKPRIFSLDQIKDLFYIHLNRSDLCHQFHQICDRTQESEENIKQLILQDDALKTYFDDKLNKIEQRFNKMQDQMDRQQFNLEQKAADLSNKVNYHTDQISKLNDFQKDMTRFQDHVKVQQEKTTQKINFEKANLTDLIESSNNNISQRLLDLDKYVTESFENVNDTIETFKVQSRELMDQKEKNILAKLSVNLQEIKKQIDETARDLNQKRIEVQEKFERKFIKVKDVISKYFHNYDVDLEELKINMKVLNQKYADWSKILIEPTSLNDARLYALETRLHEEEDIRIKEYDYLRDLFKKLIFSLEQTNLSNLDLQKTANLAAGAKSLEREVASMAQNSRNANTGQLPNLLQTQGSSISRGGATQNEKQLPNISDITLGLQNKTNDILMLKRLNFLKNSLDSHSPKATTTQMRMKSQKKRDERVVEIWKKEIEQPSVQQILNSYVKNKPPLNISLDEQSLDKTDVKSSQQDKIPAIKYHSVTRNNQDPLSIEESVVLSKRGDHYNQLVSTTFDTSVSQIKASNDSAFLTQKIQVANNPYGINNRMNQTISSQQSKLHQSISVTDDYKNSKATPMNRNQGNLTIADKINKNKFITQTDRKKMLKEAAEAKLKADQPNYIKDKLYDTFWSDFDSQMVDRAKQSQPKQRPTQLESLNESVQLQNRRMNQTITTDFMTKKSKNEDQRRNSQINQDLQSQEIALEAEESQES